jgi:RES domain
LYLGTTLDCALVETVFHDVPYAPGIKIVAKASHVSGRVFSAIRLTRDFRLIDLRSIALRKLGIPRSRLTDTDAADYANTRLWALALYEQHTAAEGLVWTSRQDDSAQAVLFFGDRTGRLHCSQISGPNTLLLSDGSAIPELLSLAMRLGVLLV